MQQAESLIEFRKVLELGLVSLAAEIERLLALLGLFGVHGKIEKFMNRIGFEQADRALLALIPAQIEVAGH